MGAVAIQDSAHETNIFLSLAGVPALGVLPTDLTVRFRKQGETALTTKTMDGTNWIEIGEGFYILKRTAEETDTLGIFFYDIDSAKHDNILFDEFVIIEPEGGVPAINPDLCEVSGRVLNSTGSAPLNGAQVKFRPVNSPNEFDSAVVNAEPVFTHTQYDGTFKSPLIRNLTVVVEIDRAGIRHQITIPDAATANLSDLLPPLPAIL